MLTGTLKVKHIDFKNVYHQFCVGGNFFLHLSNHPDVGAQKDIDSNIHLKKKFEVISYQFRKFSAQLLGTLNINHEFSPLNLTLSKNDFTYQ